MWRERGRDWEGSAVGEVGEVCKYFVTWLTEVTWDMDGREAKKTRGVWLLCAVREGDGCT